MHLATHAHTATLDVKLAESYMETNAHLAMCSENILSWMEQPVFRNAPLAIMVIELKLNVNRARNLVKVVEMDLPIATPAISNILKVKNITRKENVRLGAMMDGLYPKVSMISPAKNVVTTVGLASLNLTIV